MALTPNQQNKLLNHMGDIWKNRTCQLCGHNKWTISDTVFELREFKWGAIEFGNGSRVLPIVSVTCENCGNIHLFNALSIGVIDYKNEGEQNE